MSTTRAKSVGGRSRHSASFGSIRTSAGKVSSVHPGTAGRLDIPDLRSRSLGRLLWKHSSGVTRMSRTTARPRRRSSAGSSTSARAAVRAVVSVDGSNARRLGGPWDIPWLWTGSDGSCRGRAASLIGHTCRSGGMSGTNGHDGGVSGANPRVVGSSPTGPTHHPGVLRPRRFLRRRLPTPQLPRSSVTRPLPRRQVYRGAAVAHG